VERHQIKEVATRYTNGVSVQIDPRISKDQLRKAAVRLINGVSYGTPWKYTKFFNPSIDVRKQALKLRPGAQIPISLNNIPTMAYVKKIRRIKHNSRPFYVNAELIISTENLPLILENESRCTCVYCGTKSKGDEVSCDSCGAPLPDNC
jgi:hypothetical protein